MAIKLAVLDVRVLFAFKSTGISAMHTLCHWDYQFARDRLWRIVISGAGVSLDISHSLLRSVRSQDSGCASFITLFSSSVS